MNSWRQILLALSLSFGLIACDQPSDAASTSSPQEQTPMATLSSDPSPIDTNPNANTAVADVDLSGTTEIQRVISPGGIEAWLVEEHSIPLIAVEIGFKGGARLDPDSKQGLTNLLSGLLDEGAGELDSQAFQTRLEDLAIRLRFSAARDGFYGSVRTLTQHRDEAFDMLHLALTEPRFDAEPVERIRSQIMVQLNREAGNPNSIAQKAWFREAFGAHPYGRSTRGTMESVQSITADDLRGFVRDYLARSNMKVAVVGDIDADTLSTLLDKTFGDLPADAKAIQAQDADVPDTGQLIVLDREQPQSIAKFGGPGLMLDDPDFFPAFVLNYIMGGGGFASILMEEVREKKGLAYGVGTSLVTLDHAGFLFGSVATDNNRISETLNIIKEQFAKVRDQGVTAEQLQNAKTYLTGSFPLRFDSNSSIANQLVGYQMVGRPIDYINTRNATIEAVTLEQVNKVAKRLYNPEQLTIVVIGKPAGLEEQSPVP